MTSLSDDEAPFRLDDRDLAAEVAAGTAFDLSQCVNEPIHLLGGIQSYGTLLALDAADVIAVAGSNSERVLGRPAAALVGTPVAALIGPDGLAAVHETLRAPTGDRGLIGLHIPPGGPEFDATVYRSDGVLVIELEPAAVERPFQFARFYPRLRSTLTRLQNERTVLAACAAAVTEIRALTGYDRVVAYRFEGREGPGEVIAESVAAGLDPWQGLWFPATDIPPQARRLYERNWIRVIQDVDDDTAVLVPPLLSDTGAPLDLSDSTLRTVSGFHLEYLRNIAVRSSMSVSLLRDGELWGLIACHGLEPRTLSPEVRTACEFFGVMLSLQLAALQDAETARARQTARKALAQLVTALDTDIAQSVRDNGALLAQLVPADAVVLRAADLSTGALTTVIAHGDAAEFDAAAVDTLWSLLPPITAGQVWSSGCLGDHDPALTALSPALSGALVLGLDSAGTGIAWLRRERRAARTWATDPAQPVRLGPRGERLTPRGSSAVYEAVVRGCSTPWTAPDEAVVQEFGHAITTVVLRHTARLAALNSELRRANHDLDTFAHAAAHELKEPLRGISNSATFIGEDAGDSLDPTTVRRLGTIRTLAVRMDELINSLLHFAQLGQGELRREPVELRAATERALQIAGARLEEQEVAITLPEPGVTVPADPDRLQEILINLLVNAAKYAGDEPPRTVEVGVRADGPVPVYFVRDNGIGIPEADQKEVLRLFRRLHPRESRGGGHGAGLAIVDRIVERHGGRLWLESAPGAGTTVFFTLEAGPGAG
ncbi:ATP-binding protein [Nocardia sp. NPDC050697]|uniref:ATP-binding protein n=1 Tax=Nocardia sp. NPDC050697 TaxID=3155158 RepID=UPI0033D765B8